MEWYWWVIGVYCLIGFVLVIAVIISEIRDYRVLPYCDRDFKMIKILIFECLKDAVRGIFWGCILFYAFVLASSSEYEEYK